jgi:uncharacterized protein YjdB
VATVDPHTGEITAVAVGTTTITARSTADRSLKAICTVNVLVPLASINIPPSITIGKGSSIVLPVTFLPSNTTGTGVTWSSDNTGVATVDSTTGLISASAVTTGTATITATSTADNTKTASCALTVAADHTGAGVNVLFEGVEDETIILDARLSQGNQLVVTAPSGFDRYLWYFNDGSSWGLTTTPVFYLWPAIGRHNITVIVEKDGYHFSKTLIFTVGY